MARKSHHIHIGNVLLLFFSLCLGVLGVELALRARTFNGYGVWAPRISHTFRPQPKIMPGVYGESSFTTSRVGIRGDDFSRDSDYRILAMGGSATECLYLDDNETWPHFIQKWLSEESGGPDVWVGNIGQSGHGSRSHIIELGNLLPQYPRIDAAIVMVGVNDLLRRLQQDRRWEPMGADSAAWAEVYRWTFAVNPVERPPVVLLPELWTRLDILYRRIRGKPPRVTEAEGARNLRQDPTGSIYVTWRAMRFSSAMRRTQLPDLTEAIEDYRQHINAVIDVAREHSVRIVFLTQPVLWHANMPEESRRLLWMGGVGSYQEIENAPYYSGGALALGMELYNRALTEVCAARGVECIDLAAVIPRNTDALYDDCHFNQAGARLVARTVVDYLRSTHPFTNRSN